MSSNLKTSLGFQESSRDLATEYLCFIQTIFRLHRPIVLLLAEILRITNRRQIIDLCSGGKPVLEIQEALSAAELNISITLTDRFANSRAFRQIEEASEKQIRFVRESVDARSVPDQPDGFRTMFNSFHHFRESDARRILRDAVNAGEPLAICEYAERTLPIVLLTMIPTPFLVALGTPFIRPFRWSRLFLTYLPPLIPLTCWWDGVVSYLRAYTVEKLKTLTKDLLSGFYSWHAGTIALHRWTGHLNLPPRPLSVTHAFA